MKCQNCGTENASTSKFCMNCGSPLKMPEAVDSTEKVENMEAVDSMEAADSTEKVENMEAVDSMETADGTEAARQQVYSQNPDEGYSYGYQQGQSYSSQQNPDYSYQPGQQSQSYSSQQNPGYGYQQNQSYGGQQNQSYGYGQGLNVPLKPLKKRGNGMGIASLVCGIAGFAFCWVFIPAWVLGPLAIIFGMIQCCTRRKKGLGIAGSILGAAAVILSIVIFVWAVGDDTPSDSGQSREINRQAHEENENKDNNEHKEDTDYKSENAGKTDGDRKEVNRNAGSSEEDNSARGTSASEYIEGIGSFSVPDDWVYDEYSSTEEVFVYIPASADPEYLSDYMLLQVLENDYTFDDVDELVKINKNELIRQYGVDPEDVSVYTREDLDIPMIAYEFSAYDSDVDEEMKIWEYHVIGDNYQAIFSSVDYSYWRSGDTAVKDCAYEAAKSYCPD